MAIGTKVKVGFDGSAVKQGVSRMTGMFTGLGKTIGRIGRQTAIGGARRAGETLFGLGVRAVSAIPQEISRLADYAAEIRNVAGDTKTTTAEIMAMHKALQLQGMDVDMAADTFREFATKMGEASKEVDSEPMKALNDLGLFQPDIKGKGVAEQMQIFASAIKGFTGSQQDLAFIMDRFLGGDLGLKAIAFFQNYAEAMEDGRRLTKGFAQQMEASTDDLRDVIRLRGVIQQKFSEFALAAFGVGRGQAGEWITKLEGMDLAAKGEEFGRIMRQTFVWIREEGGVKAIFENSMTWLREEMYGLGQRFGEGAKQSLKDAVNPASLFGLGSFGKGGAKDESTTFLDRIEAHTARANSLLERIERQKGAVYV